MATTERKPSAVGIAPEERVNLLSNGLSGTNLERGSSHNLRVTLQAIRLNAPVTKVELAEITGLTPPSITNIARKLFADGLISEAGRRRGERGQPALKLAINPDGAFSIGVNVDRDHMTMVALDFLGELRMRVVENIQFPMPDQVRHFVSRNLDAMRADDLVSHAFAEIALTWREGVGEAAFAVQRKQVNGWVMQAGTNAQRFEVSL